MEYTFSTTFLGFLLVVLYGISMATIIYLKKKKDKRLLANVE